MWIIGVGFPDCFRGNWRLIVDQRALWVFCEAGSRSSTRTCEETPPHDGRGVKSEQPLCHSSDDSKHAANFISDREKICIWWGGETSIYFIHFKTVPPSCSTLLTCTFSAALIKGSLVCPSGVRSDGEKISTNCRERKRYVHQKKTFTKICYNWFSTNSLKQTEVKTSCRLLLLIVLFCTLSLGQKKKTCLPRLGKNAPACLNCARSATVMQMSYFW